VGKSRRHLEWVQQQLQSRGIKDRTVVVFAGENEPLGSQYLAPFAGVAFAENERAKGGHVLVLIDDLAKHGTAYLSLRKAAHHTATSDLGQVHGLLLERICPLSPALGGGSITALCVGEVSSSSSTAGSTTGAATGVVSQEVLDHLSMFLDFSISTDARLALSKVFPPISTRNVIARAGSRFQPPLTQSLVAALNANLVQSERTALSAEWAAQMGLHVEDDESEVLNYREKLQELLQQQSKERLSTGDQLVVLTAASRNFLAHMEHGEGAFFEAGVLQYLGERHADLLARVRALKLDAKLSPELAQELMAAVKGFEAAWAKRNSV
jgi:F-type H+-transporting ATPase subunit alpha